MRRNDSETRKRVRGQEEEKEKRRLARKDDPIALSGSDHEISPVIRIAPTYARIQGCSHPPIIVPDMS